MILNIKDTESEQESHIECDFIFGAAINPHDEDGNGCITFVGGKTNSHQIAHALRSMTKDFIENGIL